MINRMPLRGRPQPALTRLAALAPLDEAAWSSLVVATARPQPVRSKHEIAVEGDVISEPRLVVSGWAARVRQLADGRRQLLSFLLPGDLIGLCDQPCPVATSSVVALTGVTICAAPAATVSPALAQAYALSRALEEAHLLSHIARLGRLTAQERIGDLLLELLERLHLAGLADETSFDFPLTQEMLGDALGLTSVHVNRMVQLSRRDGDIDWRQGRLTIRDPARLARNVGRVPVQVSSLAIAPRT